MCNNIQIKKQHLHFNSRLKTFNPQIFSPFAVHFFDIWVRSDKTLAHWLSHQIRQNRDQKSLIGLLPTFVHFSFEADVQTKDLFDICLLSHNELRKWMKENVLFGDLDRILVKVAS